MRYLAFIRSMLQRRQRDTNSISNCTACGKCCVSLMCAPQFQLQCGGCQNTASRRRNYKKWNMLHAACYCNAIESFNLPPIVWVSVQHKRQVHVVHSYVQIRGLCAGMRAIREMLQQLRRDYCLALFCAERCSAL